MKHSTSRENCGHLIKNNPNSDVKLAGEKKIKTPKGKMFHLADATKVEGEGKKARKKG